MALPRPISGHRRRLLLARLVANGLGQAGAAVATGWGVQAVFGRLAGGGRPPGGVLLREAGVLALAAALAAALRSQERVDSERLGQHYVHDLRMLLFDRVAAMSPRALARKRQGSLALRFMGDVSALRRWVSLGLARLVVATTLTGGTLVALAVAQPSLAVAVGVALALGAAASVAIGRGLREAAREARRHRARLAANANERVATVNVMRAFGRQDGERHRLRRQSRLLGRAMVARARAAGRLQATSEATTALATSGALLVGSVEVSTGSASPATVVAAMSIVALLTSPLRDLGRAPEYWNDARVARDVLEAFLAPDGDIEAPAPAPRVTLRPDRPLRLELESIAVEEALGPMTAVAAPGTVTAIVGPNGAGKSTLLSLCAGLDRPDQGRVLLDGQELSSLGESALRQAVSIAGPDLPLVRGTIERNVRYRMRDAAPEEVERVAALCGLNEILSELPDGWRTRVSEGGRNLSAGTRQRVALARAMLGSPRLLLLDEADANLDPRSTAVLDQVIRAVAGHATILVVTHRRSLLDAVDRVWHLDDGRLIEEGAPKELLCEDSATARLFTSMNRPALVAVPPRAA